MLPLLPPSCYVPCPSHAPWLHDPNCTWWRVQVMKLLIMQFSLTSCHFIPLQSQYSPQHLSFGHLSKESVKIRGPLWHFVTSLFFMVRSCQPYTQPTSRRTTHCRLPVTAYSIYSDHIRKYYHPLQPGRHIPGNLMRSLSYIIQHIQNGMH
jgi:hypothetical protein